MYKASTETRWHPDEVMLPVFFWERVCNWKGNQYLKKKLLYRKLIKLMQSLGNEIEIDSDSEDDIICKKVQADQDK